MKQDKAYKHRKGFTYGWFFQQTYMRTFVVVANSTFDQARDFIIDKYSVDIGELSNSHAKSVIFDVETDTNNEPVNLLWFSSVDWTPESIATYSHECNHAALDLLNDRDAEPLFSKDIDFANEHFTYLQAEILRRTLDIISQHYHIKT